VAGVAAKAGEASGPYATRKELAEFTLDERGDTAAFFGGPQEGREIRPHT